MNRYAARRDTHEAEIVATLRSAGATVQRLSIPGCPDLLIGIDGRNYLAEVKQPRGVLTADEQYFHQTWRGQCVVIRSAAEALALIGRA